MIINVKKLTVISDIEEMEKEEKNKCVRKFHMAARKQDGSYYNKATLTSIRAAIDTYLRNEPNSERKGKELLSV